MTAPVPLLGSALSSARTGTDWLKIGVRTFVPTNSRYRSSLGLTTTATHAASSSGRVVAIGSSRPSSAKNGIVVKSVWTPGLSSTSAWATPVWHSGHHNVGAEFRYTWFLL